MAKLVWWGWLSLMIQFIDALNPIIAKGSMLFDGVTNERFYVKGLGYYRRNRDGSSGTIELTSIEACRDHIDTLKDTGINLIRFYYIDSTKDHDECMQLLEKENIYIAIDLDGANRSKIRERHYDTTVLDRYKETIDAFDKYDNVAFYLVGFEITHSPLNPEALSFIKTSVRDIKAHIKTKNHQTLVGYVSLDDKGFQDWEGADTYLNCGEKEVRPDFIGVSTHTWCNQYEDSNSNREFVNEYKGFGLPVLISDFRCESVYRTFSHKFNALINEMDSVFSGGIINAFNPYYETILKLNDRHRVITRNVDLIDEMKEVFLHNPKLKQSMKHYDLRKPIPSTCPTTNNYWKLHPNLPPKIIDSECQCMFRKLECIAQPQESYPVSEFRTALTRLTCDQPNCTSFVLYNYSSGEYGIAASCPPRHRLSWLLNEYYLQSDRKQDSCQSNLFQQAQGGETKTCFKNHKEKSRVTYEIRKDPNSSVVAHPISFFTILIVSNLSLLL